MSSAGGGGGKSGRSSSSSKDKIAVVHRMEGYFDKLKSKKALGTDFNKRYFAIVRTPDNRFYLNYYGKRVDLADESKPSGSIPLADINFVGVPMQAEEDGGRPDFKVGDPQKRKKKRPSLNGSSGGAPGTPGTPSGLGGDGLLAHNPVMEKHAARGVQIGSKHQNIFIVADNRSMAQKWVAGLCFMRALPLPPGVGWPKKFGAPPPCLFTTDKDGKILAPAELPRKLQGYLNSVVIEKDGPGAYSCKLKRRYFVVHDTNSPKRGSMELALCQYSKRESAEKENRMSKCKGFLFLRHITKVERIDIQLVDREHPFLAGPPLLDTIKQEDARKVFVRDQLYLQDSNSVHGIQIHSPHMNLFVVAVSEEHLQYWVAGLTSVCGLDVPDGIAWDAKLHGPIPQAPAYIKHYRGTLAKKQLQAGGKGNVGSSSIPSEPIKAKGGGEEEEEKHDDFVQDDQRDNSDDDEAEAEYLRKQALLRGDGDKKHKPKQKVKGTPTESKDDDGDDDEKAPVPEGKDDDDDDDDDDEVVKRPSSRRARSSGRPTRQESTSPSSDHLSSTLASTASNGSSASASRRQRRQRRQVVDDSDSDGAGSGKGTVATASARSKRGSDSEDDGGGDDGEEVVSRRRGRGRSSRARSRSRHRSRSRGAAVASGGGGSGAAEGSASPGRPNAQKEAAILARKRGSLGSGFQRLRTAGSDDDGDGDGDDDAAARKESTLTPSKAKALDLLRASMGRPAAARPTSRRNKRGEGYDHELSEGHEDEFRYDDDATRKQDTEPQESEADAALRRLENRASNVHNRSGPTVEQLELQRQRNMAFAKARSKGAHDPQAALSMQRKIEMAIEQRAAGRSGRPGSRSRSRGRGVLGSDDDNDDDDDDYEGARPTSTRARSKRVSIESRSQLAAPFGRNTARTRTPKKPSPSKPRFRGASRGDTAGAPSTPSRGGGRGDDGRGGDDGDDGSGSDWD